MNMTPEEMNTQLYEKLTAEQAKYRDWLMGQPPEEILNHGMGGVSWPGRRAAGCVLAHGGHLWGVDRTEKF